MRSVIRCIVTAITALVLALGPAPWAPSPAAQAFEPDVHIAMFQETVGNKFSDEAQAAVAEGLEYPDSASINIVIDPLLKPFTMVGPGQEHSEWHFDNARNPEEICKLWNAHVPGKMMGPEKLLFNTSAYAVEAFRKDPLDPVGMDRVGAFRRVALFHYGEYLHAIQDFYSHTNWIELHAAAGKQAGLAPIQAGCDAKALAALQPKLQSGYFNIQAGNIDFCDYQYIFGTYHLPAGYDYCHGPAQFSWKARFLSGLKTSQMLAKDSSRYYHGGETLVLPDGSKTTYHQEAKRLATLATPEAFIVFHDRVVASFKKELPDRDPDCLFEVLLKGGDPACPKRVGLGNHYQGELAVADAQVASLLTNPPGRYGELRDVHAEIQLDLITNSLLGGSFSFEGFLASPPFPANARDVYTASTAEGVGPFVATPGGILGRLVFRGTSTTYLPDGTSTGGQDDRVFLYASDQAGRFVLCPDEPTNATLSDPETDRQECVARAVIELQPVQPIA